MSRIHYYYPFHTIKKTRLNLIRQKLHKAPWCSWLSSKGGNDYSWHVRVSLTSSHFKHICQCNLILLFNHFCCHFVAIFFVRSYLWQGKHSHILFKGPRKKWTKHVQQSHFLKLQVIRELGRTPGILGWIFWTTTFHDLKNFTSRSL